METTKYPRTEHFIWSKSTTSDDRISKDHSGVENVPIIISEKLDGSNSSIAKKGVYPRSYGIISQNPWDDCIWEIHERIKKDIDEDTFIFGENLYATHSLKYNKLDSYFYVFGVRIKDEWISWDDVLELSYLLDLNTVPVFFKGTTNSVKEIIEALVKSLSVFDAYDTKTNIECMEGVVCRRASAFNNDDFYKYVLKMVRANHVNTDEHWTKNWKRQPLKWENENKKSD